MHGALSLGFGAAILLGISWRAVAAETSRGPTPTREALAAVEGLGGRVALSGQQGSGEALGIDLSERPVGDDDLCCLESFADLQRLTLRGWEVTDKGLAHLEELDRLQTLRLTHTGITDAGISRLKNLGDLRALDLAGSFRVTDNALAVLESLPHLERLDLTFTRTTDGGIRALHEARPKLEIRRRYNGRGESRPTASDAPLLSLGRSPPGARGEPTVDPSRFIPKAEALLARWPEVVETWRFLAWNVGYNIPAELDDPRERYFWASQSIKVLTTGAACNKKAATLLWDVGWYTGTRIGRTDDADHFRDWFSDDAELHRLLIEGLPRERVLGPSGKPDNWLVAREWFLKAERLIDSNEDADIGALSPLLLFSESAKCQLNYAEAIEREGCFGERAEDAWREGEVRWRAFGDRLLPMASAGGEPHRLSEWEELAEQGTAAGRTADTIRRYRTIVNYDYWLARARIEQEDATIHARQLLYEARKELTRQLTQADPAEGPDTGPLFERAFRAWAAVLRSHPEFADEEDWCREVLDAVRIYREHVLRAPNLPDDFPLGEYMDRWTDQAAERN